MVPGRKGRNEAGGRRKGGVAWRCLHGVYGAQTSNEQRTRKWTSQKGGGLTHFPLSLLLRWRHVTRTLRGFFCIHAWSSKRGREGKQRKRGVFNCPNDLVPVPLPWILGRLTHFGRPDFAALFVSFWTKCSSSLYRMAIPRHSHCDVFPRSHTRTCPRRPSMGPVGPTDADDGDILY